VRTISVSPPLTHVPDILSSDSNFSDPEKLLFFYRLVWFFFDFSAIKSEQAIIADVLTWSPFCYRLWNESILQDACQLLSEDMPLASGAPGGQVEYRRSLASSFFFRFYLKISQQLGNGEVRVNYMTKQNVLVTLFTDIAVLTANGTSR